jgi:transposase
MFKDLCRGWSWNEIAYVIADKGYDSNPIRRQIQRQGAQPVIPYKPSRLFPGTYDQQLYRTRVHIERFFARLKENKRIHSRFDKLDITFTAFILLAIIKALPLLPFLPLC